MTPIHISMCARAAGLPVPSRGTGFHMEVDEV